MNHAAFEEGFSAGLGAALQGLEKQALMAELGGALKYMTRGIARAGGTVARGTGNMMAGGAQRTASVATGMRNMLNTSRLGQAVNNTGMGRAMARAGAAAQVAPVAGPQLSSAAQAAAQRANSARNMRGAASRITNQQQAGQVIAQHRAGPQQLTNARQIADLRQSRAVLRGPVGPQQPVRAIDRFHAMSAGQRKQALERAATVNNAGKPITPAAAPAAPGWGSLQHRGTQVALGVGGAGIIGGGAYMAGRAHEQNRPMLQRVMG